MAERIHITSAIHYANAAPHLGHTYETVAADVFARHYRRRLGAKNVSFVTGTDEHGEKMVRAAESAGVAPRALVDRTSAAFRAAFTRMHIKWDRFVRTTDPEHQKFVQRMLTLAHQRGEIYFREYQGLYCVGCERFYTEKELLPGNLCPAHNSPVELLNEANYFLRLEKHRERIRNHIAGAPGFIRPERFRNEALQMLAEPIDDLCISRPKARLDWGIEMPFDANYVTYVWYDAFWAYVSELPDTTDAALKDLMPAAEHFIGKDILKTHAIYWPAMLMAAGLPCYRHLNVHGWLNIRGSRMSKSSGNVLDPLAYVDAFGPGVDGAEVMRYFVMREFVYGLDGDFSEDRLFERYNADLANDLGNLTSRVLTMAARYFGGEMTAQPGTGRGPLDAPLCAAFTELHSRAGALVEALAFNRALETVWQVLDAANKYIVAAAPFTLAREPANLPRVGQILANLLEGLRVAADELEPFMPVTSRRMLQLLNCDEQTAREPFGRGLKQGHKVNPPVPLFPRLDLKSKI